MVFREVSAAEHSPEYIRRATSSNKSARFQFEFANLERFSMWRKTPLEACLSRRLSASEAETPSCVSAFRHFEAKAAPSLSRSVRMTTFLEPSKAAVPLLLTEEREAMRPLYPSLRRAFSSR